jgi:hypothetical protein
MARKEEMVVMFLFYLDPNLMDSFNFCWDGLERGGFGEVWRVLGWRESALNEQRRHSLSSSLELKGMIRSVIAVGFESDFYL